LEKFLFDVGEKKFKARIDKGKEFKSDYKNYPLKAKTDHEQRNLSQNREY
jgi:hypothetical protein